MAKTNLTRLIEKLPLEQQKQIREQAKQINEAREKARRDEAILAKCKRHGVVTH